MKDSNAPSTGSRHNTANAPEVICGVEDGWRGVREFSLAASREGRGVLVLIRGLLEPEVFAMITTPPRMRVLAVKPRWFRLRLVWEILRAASRGRLRWVVVTKDKTRRLLSPVTRLVGSRITRLVETEEGYRLEGNPPESLVAGTLKGLGV
jgi:hypothetical protein